MTITYQDAKDEVFGIVKSVINAKQTSVFGYTVDVRYPGAPKASQPDTTKLWARVSSQIVTDAQTALGNNGGIKLYEAVALLYVQLFAPRNVGASSDNCTILAEFIRSEFRKASPSGNVWFLNQQIRELPETDTSYPVNVVVEFRYHTEQ